MMNRPPVRRARGAGGREEWEACNDGKALKRSDNFVHLGLLGMWETQYAQGGWLRG